ncbi:MAG: GNAT family N-acetyltransferase [Nocardioides sp.]
MLDLNIRPARTRDLAHLGAIEDSGLPLFESALGDLTGTALAAKADCGQERAEKPGFILVAGDPPIGFAHVLLIDGQAHLEQLSVHPEHGRQGIGGALIEAVCERLAAKGFGAVTLMTYADLAWNGPFYAKHGFVEVPPEDPRTALQLRAVQREQELGLGRFGRRILMRRPLRQHRTTAELTDFLSTLDATPKDAGTLRLVLRRPAEGEREVLDVAQLDVRVGVVGDNWIDRPSSRTPDNTAHPDMQLNVMSHPMVQFLAQDREREPLAGDQLYLDLDLSHDNLPAGTRLEIGADAVIEVTAQPHTGCAKFIARFGKDAMAFVNGPEGKPRRLRGLCAKVVEEGAIRVGDRVVVQRP